MDKRRYFLKILKKAQKKYSPSEKRLAAEEWAEAWQTLIATIMSAQSRDELTIPVAEKLFKRYPTLESLASAKHNDVFNIIKSINYNKTKTRHVIAAAKFILDNYDGHVPDDMDRLVAIPGVGRKTANIVLTEVHEKDGIPVDTHVHRLSNVLGLVKTKTPPQTEIELMKIAPRRYWSEINRLFVLWGKEVRGRDKKKLLKALNKGR